MRNNTRNQKISKYSKYFFIFLLWGMIFVSQQSFAGTVSFGLGYDSFGYGLGYGYYGFGYSPYNYIYNNYKIYVGPRYYAPVRYPQLGRWKRRELRMIASQQMETKRVIYFAQKDEQAKKNALKEQPAKDIQIHIDDHNSDKQLIPDNMNPNKEGYKPKETQKLSHGTVVMNTY